MTFLEQLEALSYIVTVVGLPLAIYTFIKEQRKERQNEDEEVYVRLSDQYSEFLELVLKNADLQLTTRSTPGGPLSPEQTERRSVLFEILISLFERAYILVYEDEMSPQADRLWKSWEDYMREWCRRPDFRGMLPTLLRGEDPDFCAYITRIASEESPTGGES